MALDEGTVARVAHLARIRVKDERLKPLAGELDTIVNWVEQLGEVDTNNVAPMTSVVEMQAHWRQDAVSDGGYPDRVTGNAPDGVADPEGAFYGVPKVVE